MAGHTMKQKSPQTTSNKTLAPVLRHKLPLSILLLGFMGFLDATYLTVLGFSRQIPPCTATHGCESVLTSQFAYVGPIPIALFGVGFFITVMVIAIMLLQKNTLLLRRILLIITTLAFLAGMGLIYLQAFVIQAFCQYCLIAELIMTLLFILSAILMKKSIKG